MTARCRYRCLRIVEGDNYDSVLDFEVHLDNDGWHTLYVPSAEAIHHNQQSNDLSSGLPRIVEFHRNRDLYMRKHRSKPEAMVVRLLTAWTYGLRTLASLVLPGAPTRIYAAHTRQALFPYRGEGLADRATRS